MHAQVWLARPREFGIVRAMTIETRGALAGWFGVVGTIAVCGLSSALGVLAASGCPGAQPKVVHETGADGATPPAGACGKSPIRSLDIDAEVAAINAVKGAGDEPEDWDGVPALRRFPSYAAHLEALGMGPTKEAVAAEPSTWGEAYTCTASVRPFELERGSGDRLVQVDCLNHAFEFSGVEHFEAHIFRPVGRDRVCEIGAFDSARQTDDRPCLTQVPDDVPWAFELVELVRPGTFAVQLTYYGGHCADIERGDKITREFWGLEGGIFVKYAEGVLADATYHSPCPPTAWTDGAFTIGTSFPKTLTLTTTLHCEAPAADDCDKHEPCAAGHGSQTLTYDHGAYSARSVPFAP